MTTLDSAMKYRTKQQRLVALVDAYTMHRAASFTTAEVSNWAIANGLWPVPKRGDAEAICRMWESRLQEALER